MTKFRNFISLKQIIIGKNKNKLVFIITSIILLLTAATMSKDAGISGDEYFHVDHAVDVAEYYKSLGKDKTALFNEKTLHLYGQSLDNLVHFFNEAFNIDDIYRTRHLFSSIVGWILILFTGLTASLLFGWQAGHIALLLMFFSPRILGHSFNNLKDIPFAAAYTFTIYFILLYLKQIPRINIKTLFPIVLGIAWAISLRIGGIILIPYLFLFTGLYFVIQKQPLSHQNISSAFKNGKYLIFISIIAFFVGLLLWPYALSKPLSNPFESLKSMTNYTMDLNQLFEGEIQKSTELPWYYGIKYILITSPIIVFIGFIAFVFSIRSKKIITKANLYSSLLLFAFVFPLAYTIYKDSNLYGGWRHLLWVYSPLVVLAAGGIATYVNHKNKYIKYVTIATLIVFLFLPVKHTFKNNNCQYIYYNQLVGGIEGAYGKYEMDYYYHSLREGAEWLIQNELSEDTITIATNHHRITKYLFRKYPQVKIASIRYYVKGRNDWDYAIWANTHIIPQQIEKGYWPPKHTIYTMDVNKIPVGVVMKRISNEDFKGFRALREGNSNLAKNYFKNALALNPENDEAYEGYGNALYNKQEYDSTIIYVNNSLKYNPHNVGAWLLKTASLNMQKKFDEALPVADTMLKVRSDFAPAHFHKGFALKNLGKPNEAIKEFQLAKNYQKNYPEAYMQIGEILMNYKNYDKALKAYKQVFIYKPNDLLATVNTAKCYHLLNDNIKADKIINSLKQGQNRLETTKVKFRIEFSRGNMKNAAFFLNTSSHIHNDSELFVLRAMVAMKQNKKDLAIKYLNTAKELDPINREAQELLKMLQVKSKQSLAAQQTQQKPAQQQSIMFQKPKPQKTSPIQVPTK